MSHVIRVNSFKLVPHLLDLAAIEFDLLLVFLELFVSVIELSLSHSECKSLN